MVNHMTRTKNDRASCNENYDTESSHNSGQCSNACTHRVNKILHLVLFLFFFTRTSSSWERNTKEEKFHSNTLFENTQASSDCNLTGLSYAGTMQTNNVPPDDTSQVITETFGLMSVSIARYDRFTVFDRRLI